MRNDRELYWGIACGLLSTLHKLELHVKGIAVIDVLHVNKVYIR